MTSRRAPKLLDQQTVTEFAEFRALKNKIEKWLKLQSASIISQLKAGYVSPLKGPYLVVLGGQDRKAIDWEQQYFDRLVTDYKAEGNDAEKAQQLATEEMVRMEVRAGKNHIDQVDVKVNPAFAGKVIEAIIKKLDSRSDRGF